MKLIKSKKFWYIFGAIVVFLIALGITLYPLISTVYNERHASEIHSHYEEAIKEVDDTTLTDAKKKADAYNQAIVPGTQENSFSQQALLSASEEYDALLNIAGDGLMGYVTIPRLGVDLPIHHGTTVETLDSGAGHVLGTSLPVGGSSTHSVISAHSGVATQKLFSDLDKLEMGDVFYLEVLGETLAYQVDDINTVLPHDSSKLGIQHGADLCTLVTCVPFGINTHRLLVRGHRIPYEEATVIEETQEEIQAPPKSTWMEQYLKGIFMGVVPLPIPLIIRWCIKRRELAIEYE